MSNFLSEFEEKVMEFQEVFARHLGGKHNFDLTVDEWTYQRLEFGLMERMAKSRRVESKPEKDAILVINGPVGATHVRKSR